MKGTLTALGLGASLCAAAGVVLRPVIAHAGSSVPALDAALNAALLRLDTDALMAWGQARWADPAVPHVTVELAAAGGGLGGLIILGVVAGGVVRASRVSKIDAQLAQAEQVAQRKEERARKSPKQRAREDLAAEHEAVKVAAERARMEGKAGRSVEARALEMHEAREKARKAKIAEMAKAEFDTTTLADLVREGVEKDTVARAVRMAVVRETFTAGATTGGTGSGGALQGAAALEEYEAREAVRKAEIKKRVQEEIAPVTTADEVAKALRKREVDKAIEEASVVVDPPFATEEELEDEGWLAGEPGDWPLGIDVQSGRMVYLARSAQNQHGGVMAATRAGKTAGFLAPWILAESTVPLARRASLILFDPKGELAEEFGGILRARGYRVRVYDPMRAGGLRYNPLALMPSTGQVKAYTSIFVRSVTGKDESDYWTKGTIDLLTGGVIMTRAEEKAAGRDPRAVSLLSVARWYRAMEAGSEEEVDERLMALKARVEASGDETLTDIVQTLAGMATSPRQKQGIMSGYRQVMERLQTETLDQRATVGESVDGMEMGWATFVAEPTVVIVTVPMKSYATVRPFLVTFLTSAMGEFDRIAGEGNRPLPRPVRIIADEFANMGEVPEMEMHFSAMGFRDVGIYFATQGRRDIRTEYKAKADRIWPNVTMQAQFYRSNAEDKAYYASQYKDKRITVRTLSRKGTVLIHRNGGSPIQVHIAFWFADKTLVAEVTAAKARCTLATLLGEQEATRGPGGVSKSLDTPLRRAAGGATETVSAVAEDDGEGKEEKEDVESDGGKGDESDDGWDTATDWTDDAD